MFSAITNRQKIYIAVAFLMLLGGLFVYTFVSRFGKTEVKIIVIPRDATILANNKKIETGTVYLTPQKYTFTAKKSGFSDDSQTVTVGKNSTTVSLIPTPSSAAAFEFLRRNPTLQQQRDGIDSERQAVIGKTTSRKYPFFSQLPIIYDHGNSSIGSGPSITKPDDKAVIVKDIFTSGRAADLDVMRQSGFNPADYIVEFPDFANPLLGEVGD